MTLRALTVQILVALVLLATANAGISMVSRNSSPRQLLRRADLAQPATDLFLGNSTMAAGIDEAAFAAAKPGRALNLALGATSPVEHYVIYLRQSKHSGAALYYGIFDTQLTDPPKGGWNSLVGNRAMAYYVDPEVAFRFYAADSPARALGFRLVSRVPMLVERFSIWSKVEKARRFLGEIGMPKKETNQFGRAEDFSLLEDDPEEFTERCSWAANRGISAPIGEIFHLAKERGQPVYVVEMPMCEEHRHRFYSSPEWKNYRARSIELVREAGGVYVSAADWIADEGFADNLHLNEQGTRLFSNRLGRWVDAIH